MTELRGGPTIKCHTPWATKLLVRPATVWDEARLAEIGVHVSPSRDGRSVDLLGKSDDPSATDSIARRRRHEGCQ